jgi:hypothetical protein
VLCLSLVMLGLIDSIALAPLALAAAVLPGVSWGMRAGLAVVAAAGVLAAVLILALPRLAVTDRFLRFRLGRWLGPRTTSRGLAAQAWALVSACWIVRAVACFLLLGASASASPFRSHSSSSAPGRQLQRCRSVPRAQRHRSAPAPQR